MEENTNTTGNIEMKYEYKETTIFNKITKKLSNLFGGLDYNDKIQNLSSLDNDLILPKGTWDYKIQKWEYLYEKTKIDPMVWNERGLEGWEMVQIDWPHLDIIWKRKI